MGSDFSSVIRRAGVSSETDIANAHFLFNNALDRIFKDNPKEYSIIGAGGCNVLIKTHTVPEQYYRICFRAYLPEALLRMRKTLNVISQGDYGFLLPLESHISLNEVYHKIQLIQPLKEHPSYEELYTIFHKLLPLGEHGLAWTDYKPSNLGIVNGKIVIIDLECSDEDDIEDTIKSLLNSLQLNRDAEDIKHWIQTHKTRCATMNAYYVLLLIALIHGYTDPARFMRLTFNYTLFRIKNDIRCIAFNDTIYTFMMETPFALI